MPTNITDSSAFTDPIQMPTDGEVVDASDFLASTIQGLANRTRYNKDAIDALVAQLAAQLAPLRQVGTWSVAAAAVADNGVLTLTESADPAAAFATASNQITIAETGYYLFALVGAATSSGTSNPLLPGVRLRQAGATMQDIHGARFSATTTHRVGFGGTLAKQISAGQIIDAVAISKDSSYSADGNLTILNATLTIHRIR
jgi:hypothetical protein